MRAFFAGEVRLDRCPACGGLWLDFGKLQAVTGRELEPELLGGHTSRRCPFCRITLAPASLPGGVPVETCTACRGVYLDAGELSAMGGAEPPPPPPPERPGLEPEGGPPEPQFGLAELRAEEAAARPERASAPPEVSRFECVRCGEELPLKEGCGTRSGLMCRGCAPQPSPGPSLRALLRALLG